MTDAMRNRLAIDLDEIERQLRHAAPASAAPKPDALAELARIVGQDDPFRTLLAQQDGKTRQPQPSPAEHDDIFAAADGGEYDPRAGLQAGAYANALTPEEQRLLGYETDHRAAGPAEVHYGEYEPPREDAYAAPDLAAHLAQPRRRGRSTMVAVCALLGVGVVGAMGTLAYRGGFLAFDAASTGGEPPVVQADASPVKVQPQNPGGVEIPNQDRQIYGRGAAEAQTRVVSREEQPVDVKQAARVNVSPPGEAGVGVGAAALSAATTAALGEPRRVRTVSVRPDGTIAPADQAGSPPAPAPAAPAAPVIAAAAPPPPAPVPVRPRAEPTAAATATPQAPAPTIPVLAAAAPDASTAKGQKLAAAAPIAPAAAAVPDPVKTASTGNFAVQLGVRSSEKDARVAFQQLQQRFAADLGSQAPLIRKADVNGSTIFRVRVGPMSKQDAAALCDRLKGSGGQCFVAVN